jgi:hypothetical protein
MLHTHKRHMYVIGGESGDGFILCKPRVVPPTIERSKMRDPRDHKPTASQCGSGRRRHWKHLVLERTSVPFFQLPTPGALQNARAYGRPLLGGHLVPGRKARAFWRRPLPLRLRSHAYVLAFRSQLNTHEPARNTRAITRLAAPKVLPPPKHFMLIHLFPVRLWGRHCRPEAGCRPQRPAQTIHSRAQRPTLGSRAAKPAASTYGPLKTGLASSAVSTNRWAWSPTQHVHASSMEGAHQQRP